MFECSACTLRCIQAIAGESFSARSLVRKRVYGATRLRKPPLRQYASVAARPAPSNDELIPFESPRTGTKIDSDAEKKPNITHAVLANGASSKAVKRGDDEKKRPHAIAIENKSALLKELDWLPDRVKLAEHVHYVLRCNDPEKALNLCRLASKREEVIVSWNHVVDWYMRNGKFDDALKTYNEMKKRGQFPDAHTYTLLLRGFATTQHSDHIVSSKNVSRAVNLYNSLSSPTSRVKPNIYHTNAVLKVCAEGNDMDALWGIVSKMPERGSAAPDRVTYGIIINAIKKSAFGYYGHKNSTIDAVPARQDRAISEARAVWKDMIARWRSAEVTFDEQLVVEMARLLLGSSRIQDWDDVFNLIQQTMNIERLIPPLGSPDRKVEHVPQLQTPENETVPERDDDGWEETPSGKAFLPVKAYSKDSANFRRTMRLFWVRPGNQTLSQLLQACIQLRIPKTAGQYWDVLTSAPHDVKPNYSNFHTMLRLLRRNRASAKALALVRDAMPSAGQEPTSMSYVLAMVTCVRDMKNSNSLGFAKELVDLMEKRCDPTTSQNFSVESVVLYLMLSLSTDSAARITETLDHVHPLMHKLMVRAETELDPPTIRTAKDTSEAQMKARDNQLLLHLFRTTSGVINALQDCKMLSPEDSVAFTKKKAQYDRFVSRMMLKQQVEGNATSIAAMPHRLKRSGGEGASQDGGFAGEGDVAPVSTGRTEPALRAFRRRHDLAETDTIATRITSAISEGKTSRIRSNGWVHPARRHRVKEKYGSKAT